MNEEKLRIYWQAYTDGWLLIKNHERVQKKDISDMIRKHSVGYMNRIFCLVVWQEIKNPQNMLPLDKYQAAFTGAWKIFCKYVVPNDSDVVCNALFDEINALADRYDRNQFIRNLLIYVTLEEIDRNWRESKIL